MSRRGSSEGLSTLSDSSSTTRTPDSCNESPGFEDINRLLYLETVKRFKDEELNIKRQVEETMRKYDEAKAEYRHFYELYVKFYRTATTRAALIEKKALSDDQLQQAKSDLNTVIKAVKNDKTVAYLDPDILKKCQELVCSIKSAEATKEIKSELTEQKSSVNSIQNLSKTVQSKLEMAATQGLDYFVEMIQTLQLEDYAFNGQNDSLVEK